METHLELVSRLAHASPRPNTTRTRAARQRGFTLIEISVASGVLTLILLACFSLMTRDSQLSQSTLGISNVEMKAQQMLVALERELTDARGANPKAIAINTLAAGNTASVTVDSTLGFPDQGLLLIDRGNNKVERVSYAALGPGLASFTNLVRGLQCTNDTTHTASTEILWAALAEPIQLQVNPPPDLWDGRAREPDGVVFFRGDGSGFSYRVPTDPTGGTDYLDGDNLQWGAQVGGAPTLSGWAALVFVPISVFDEATTGEDINHDGDRTDVFDIGQIRRRTWDTSNPAAQPSDLGLGPSVVLQERCNWGGDLDGDGFDDPMFLWDSATRRLHVRLFVLGRSVSNIPIVRKVESSIFFRNQAEN